MKFYLLIYAAVGAGLICAGTCTQLQAQEYQSQETIHYPGCDITTYEDGSTTTHYYHVNSAGNIDHENTVRTHATRVPAPKPVVEAATNHSHTTPAATPIATAPIVTIKAAVVDVTTPEEDKAAMAQLAKDQAAYRENIKSGKWHPFKNGE